MWKMREVVLIALYKGWRSAGPSTPRCTLPPVATPPVALHDIADVHAFVGANVHRSGVILRDDERDDLIAEGITILLELSRRYEPHRVGYEKAGSFAGYAAKFLPGRMRDAYHAMHPEHIARRDADGRRVYEYGERPMSLQHEDMPQIPATAVVYAMPSIVGTCWDPGPTVSAALARVPAEYATKGAAQVIEALDEGFTPDEIARRLWLNRADVAECVAAVGSAVWHVRNFEEAA